MDNEFHLLHIQLRRASQQNNYNEWKKLSAKFVKKAEECLDEEVNGSELEHTAVNLLPTGRLSRSSCITLLMVYKKRDVLGRVKWSNFSAGEGLKKRLVCVKCVRGWLSQYKKDEIDWNRRHEKDGHTYLVGATTITDSCNISFNIGGWAVHPQKDSSQRVDPGYRCNGKEKTPIYPLSGVSLKVSGRTYKWSNQLFIKSYPPQSQYPLINQRMLSFTEYSRRDQSSHVEKLTGFIVLDAFNDYGIQQLRREAEYDFSQYKNKEIVVLQAITLKTEDGTSTVQYIYHRSNSTIKSKFIDLAKPSPMGIFLFVKTRHLLDKELLKMFEFVPFEVSQNLNANLGWKQNEGQLFRLKDSLFDDSYDDDSRENVIDLNKRTGQSPLIQRIKQAYPSIELPVFKSSLKTIQAFRFSESNITRISEQQKIMAKAGDKILVRTTGFKLNETMLTLEILPERLDRSALAKVDVNLTNGFACFTVPYQRNYTVYRINITARDKISVAMEFLLQVSGVRENENQPTDVKLLSTYNENNMILSKYNQLKLVDKLAIDSNTAKNLLLKGRYMELIKSELSVDKKEEFTVPTSRIQQRYIGLDLISFGSLGEKLELGQRLRSSGLYYPVPPEIDRGGDLVFLSTNKWSAFEDHIIKLSPNIHLLLTSSPLHYFGISLNNRELEDKGLKVTNHGTFIEGNIPEELKGIEIVSRPHFMDLYANSAAEQLDSLNEIINSLPDDFKVRYDKQICDYFEVTHEFYPNEGKWRVYGKYATPKGSSWQKVKKGNIGNYGIGRFPLKAEDGKGGLMYFDVVFTERKTGDERRMILRRHQGNGTVDYLEIARFMKQNDTFWADHQLEWVSRIGNYNRSELDHIFLWTGGKFRTRDENRAYDWHFFQVETLRAFTTLFTSHNEDHTGFSSPHKGFTSTFKGFTSTFKGYKGFSSPHKGHSGIGINQDANWYEMASTWPVPLRKFMLGCGRWNGVQNSDSMGGLGNDPILESNPNLKKALQKSVQKWVWQHHSGEN